MDFSIKQKADFQMVPCLCFNSTFISSNPALILPATSFSLLKAMDSEVLINMLVSMKRQRAHLWGKSLQIHSFNTS